MAGLCFGILSVKNGIETVICERNSRVGKKISQSGNGKCNIGNKNVSAEFFNRSEIAGRVCQSVPVEEYTRFLESCGIFTFADNMGRMYPLSESAASVVDCLRTQFEKFGGKFLVGKEIKSVKRLPNGFEAGGLDDVFDKVVLACGSGSSASSPDIYGIVPQKYFTKLEPSLVPLKVSHMNGILNGLRARADVRLFADGKQIVSERGEVQFKSYGVSGICVFDLSAQIARRKVSGKRHSYVLSLDLVPFFSEERLEEILQTRIAAEEPSERLFLGILHNKIAQCVTKRAEAIQNGVFCGAPADIRSDKLRSLVYASKNYTLEVESTLDFSMSQVTSGGISERFLDAKTLSLPNGVVALGEVLDVDGICGGYNLYFAAASAIYLFDKAQREIAYKKI